jgi:hypothetical protein
MRQVGSISLGLTADRREELLRQATLARAFDVEVGEITPPRSRRCTPMSGRRRDLRRHLPGDGQCDPANIAHGAGQGRADARRGSSRA